jgi:uncharacterized protein (TIGR02001 family)
MRLPAVRGLMPWLLFAAAQATLCRADGLGGSLGIASDQVLRGLTESDHQLSWQGDLHYGQDGWYGGVTAYGVRRGLDRSASAGLNLYAGYERQFSEDWRAGVRLRHYDYPGYARRNDYDYDEVSLTLDWRDRLTASVAASPDVYAADYEGNYGRGGAFTYELGGRQPLPWWGLIVNAGAGYYDLQHQVDTGYLYWSAGLSRQWRSLQLDARYVGTSQEAREHFRDLAENRLLFSVLWLF